MASRVGGGGYAENRGGFGDRTGGGMSGNARDGRDGMGQRNGGFSGAQGGLARRTSVQSPSYDASLGNLARMAGTLAPGGGLITGAGAMFGGNFGPGAGGYTGYGGQVNTPGSYDPTNRALQAGGPMGYGQPLTLMQRAGMYQGGTNAMPGRPAFNPQMFQPQPQPQPQAAPPPAAPMFSKGFMPGKTLATGGQYGVSTFRPGYDFLRSPHS